MRSKSLISVLLLGIGCYASAQAEIAINEVLANEPGSATSLEWVELYNTDSAAVNLSGWRLVEGNDTTSFGGGVVIPSKGYLILARKLTAAAGDENSFEGHWGNASGVWGDTTTEDFPAVGATMALTNTSGSVNLVSPDDSVRSFSWSEDAGDGISWEKVSVLSGDDMSNWKACTLLEGSTPGRINSVSAAENDLAVVEIVSEISNPGAGQSFQLSAKVENQGRGTSLPNQLTLFDDQDFDQVADSNEIVTFVNLDALSPLGTYTLISEIALSEGNHRLMAELGTDDKIYNNRLSLDIKAGQSLPAVVTNEIMAAPDLSKSQTEWIELYNRSGGIVNLAGWSFGDSKKESLISEDILEMGPGEFLVLAENKAELLATYPGFAGLVFELIDWQTLDNSGDQVAIRDSLGFLAERVSYPSQNLMGVSYERVDYDKSADAESNWWRCVDSSGATPGRENSVLAAYSSNIEIEIKPNPFSPDGDGFDDQVEIEFKVPLGAEMTMRIYDRKGRLIRTLKEKEPSVSGKVVWDGRKDGGDKVRSGLYILLVETTGVKREIRKEAIGVAK